MVETIGESSNIFYSCYMIRLVKLCFQHPELDFTEFYPECFHSQSYILLFCVHFIVRTFIHIANKTVLRVCVSVVCSHLSSP